MNTTDTLFQRGPWFLGMGGQYQRVCHYRLMDHIMLVYLCRAILHDPTVFEPWNINQNAT